MAEEKGSAAPLGHDPADTYSVYARFRRGRLALMRRLALRDALVFAKTARKARFHDAAGVFVTSDRTGEEVTEAERDNTPALAEPRPAAQPAAVTDAEQPEPGADSSPLDDRALYLRAERCLQQSRVATRALAASITRLTGLMETMCRAIPANRI